MSESFDLALVGTGFASAFFLDEYLRLAPKTARVLVLERGSKHDHAWQVANRSHSTISFQDQIINQTPRKPWVETLAFGGGGCWTGNTPRMHPNDFRTNSRYGVGEDWPIQYSDLEPFYVAVEERMKIAGSSEGPFPRSKPYPLPPHRFNGLDKAIAEQYPGLHLPMPSARASVGGHGRPVCCSNGVCSTCPIGAKFQVDLHMAEVFSDPRVTLKLRAPAERLEIKDEVVQGVHYRENGEDKYARADIAAVGAHAIMTPHLLLRSGLDDRALGRYLNEQIGIDVSVMLNGIQNYGGSTAVTGYGVMFLDGEFRRRRAGCLLENWNVPWLRAESGRWRERGYFKLVFEGLPQFANRVSLSKNHPDKPVVHYANHSEYMRAGFDHVPKLVEELFAHLPVESFEIHELDGLSSDAHIQGTVRMGVDPESSVVDRTLVHHRVRNLLALGSGVFPTCPAANPTLTLSALSVWAARSLLS